MNQQQLYQVLRKSGIPFAYKVWPEKKAPPLPYGVFALTEQTSFYADGQRYYCRDLYELELYCRVKSPEVEKRLEDTLTAAGLLYEKSEFYIESEQMIQITYEIEV